MTGAAKPTIGFVGLGRMGVPMAGHLARAGFTLFVNDVDAAAVSRVVAEHGATGLDRAAIGPASDVLILMLPDGRIVTEFLLAEAGGAPPLRTMKGGSVVLDMSSSAPTGTQALAAAFAERGIAVVDAPVSGGVARARTGTLAVMAGGEAEAVERVRPVLEPMAGSITHVGPTGAGHAMKALNNYVSATGLLAACEALRVAERFGIDGQRAIDVLNASTGRNNATDTKLAQFVLSETFASGFTLGLMRKDLATALALAGELGVDLPLAPRLVEIWAEAEATLGRAADHTEIARLITSAAGAPTSPAA